MVITSCITTYYNIRTQNTRTLEHQNQNIRCEHRTLEHRTLKQNTARTLEHRTIEHQNLEHQSIEHQNIERQNKEHQNIEHQNIENQNNRIQSTRTLEHTQNTRTQNTRTLEHKKLKHRILEHRILEHRTQNSRTIPALCFFKKYQQPIIKFWSVPVLVRETFHKIKEWHINSKADSQLYLLLIFQINNLRYKPSIVSRRYIFKRHRQTFLNTFVFLQDLVS